MPPSPLKRSREPATERRRAHRDGLRAETLAALFLQLKLYRILARRLKTPIGEIDLIAQRGDTVVFVEVKARAARAGEGAALGAVNHSRIGRAASYWLSRHPSYAQANLRFDVIFLAPRAWPRHHINAFDAS